MLVVFAFVGVWQSLEPHERLAIVPYSVFTTEVHAGNVDEIQIHEREIRYRSHRGDRVLFLETIGPEPDQGMLDSWKSTDPSKPAPKISFLK